MSEKPASWKASDSLIWPHIAAKLVREQHAEIERLREALILAKNSHGRMLMSDPPQDAWKFHRVDEVIAAALRREEVKP